MLDNHVVVVGRVTGVEFSRLGDNGVSHVAYRLLVPATGQASPVSLHAVFYGRLAEIAYENLNDGDIALITGWLQRRLMANGRGVLDLVGERFEHLKGAGRINQVSLIGQVEGTPRLTQSGNRTCLWFHLKVRRDSGTPRGKQASDRIRAVLSGHAASDLLTQIEPGRRVLVRGSLNSRWHRGELRREVHADEVVLLEPPEALSDDHPEA